MRARDKENCALVAKKKNVEIVESLKRKTTVKQTGVLPFKHNYASKNTCVDNKHISNIVVLNENKQKDSNHGIPLVSKPSTRQDASIKALKVQVVKNSEVCVKLDNRIASTNTSPLSVHQVNKLQKTFVAENVPNKDKRDTTTKNIVRRGNLASTTPTNSISSSKLNKTTDKQNRFSFQKPAIPTFCRVPHVYTNTPTNMSALSKQYDDLCQLEQRKLQQLNNILTHKQKVDIVYSEVTQGKVPIK